MNLLIDFNKPILTCEQGMKIKPGDLTDFYQSASDFDKSNLFFMLLASFHHYEGTGERETAAHLSFLMAYYLFVLLTPPGSYELARYYIGKAIELKPNAEYEQWLELIEQGN